jgi:PAS domain S-box-containing protein
MDQINQLKNRLEFNEARFEAIAQTASDSIVISDENSIIVFANRKTYEIFGYAEGTLVGSDLGILMPEKYRQGHRAGVQRFISTGNPKLIGHTIEIEGLRKDGTVFPLELSLSSWREEQSCFFSGIIRDVTERKEANIRLQNQKRELEVAYEELQEARYLLQEVTDAVPSVIYVSNFANKKNIFVNREIATLTGYTSQEVKSFSRDRIGQLIHPEDILALQKQDEEFRSLKNGEVLILNIRIKHKDGRWRWITTRSKIFKYDGSGQPLQIIRVFEDVTEVIEAQQTIQQQNEELAATLEELQAAEEQLREMNEELEHRVERRTRELAESERKAKGSEEQLRLITDAMPALISYLRSDITYGFVNKAYEKLFQVNRNEIIGKPVKEIIGEKAYHTSLPSVQRALNGEYVESEILQDYGKVGKRWMKAYFVPHRVEEKVVGTFVLVEDITKLKSIQLEQEDLLLKLGKASKEKEKALKKLEKNNKELERTNTDLDNFIYTASHDLKSPVTNLEGLMGILKKSVIEKLDEKEENILGMMDNSVQRLHKTIGDLVEITKHQKDLEDAVEEPLLFRELSREVKEDIYHLITESKATIQEDFEVEKVVYKKSNLRSILYNLLSNAIKYRNPERELKVELKTFVEDGCVVLSVKDNGLGLNPNQQKNLFTLFRRMHQHVEGTGVGLYTIKRIVENNRGRIEVKSEEGKGTEFLVFLTKATEIKG